MLLAQPAGFYSTFFPPATIEKCLSQPASSVQHGIQPTHDTSLSATAGSFAYSDGASQLANASLHTSSRTTSSYGHVSPKQSLSADARHSDRSKTPAELPLKRIGKLHYAGEYIFEHYLFITQRQSNVSCVSSNNKAEELADGAQIASLPDRVSACAIHFWK